MHMKAYWIKFKVLNVVYEDHQELHPAFSSLIFHKWPNAQAVLIYYASLPEVIILPGMPSLTLGGPSSQMFLFLFFPVKFSLKILQPPPKKEVCLLCATSF